MVYCRKEFLQQEVERAHGSAITKTHEGRRHHTRTIAACPKHARWETQTSADHLAGEPGPGDPRERQAAQRTPPAHPRPPAEDQWAGRAGRGGGPPPRFKWDRTPP